LHLTQPRRHRGSRDFAAQRTLRGHLASSSQDRRAEYLRRRSGAPRSGCCPDTHPDTDRPRDERRHPRCSGTSAWSTRIHPAAAPRMADRGLARISRRFPAASANCRPSLDVLAPRSST